MKTKILMMVITVMACAQVRGQAPGWAWAKGGIGTDEDRGNSIAVDLNGNTYVTGFFTSPNILFGGILMNNAGSKDVFIVKYDSLGNVIWANRFGGIDEEKANSIKVDKNGLIYITGYFTSPSVTFDSITLTNAGGTDCFIAKFDTSGKVIWAKSEGNWGYDYGNGIAVDRVGNSIITGAKSGAFFITKYNASGTIIWTKIAGGTIFDWGKEVVIDSSGNSIVTGYFKSNPFVLDTIALTNLGYEDIFIVKYDSLGNVVWAKSTGGIGRDFGFSISMDGYGSSYITGIISTPVNLAGVYIPNPGSYSIIIAKFDSIGNVLWAKSAGGTYIDFGNSIVSDLHGNTYLTGTYTSDFCTFENISLVKSAGWQNGDLFVAKYDSSGNSIWAKNVGENVYSAFGNEGLGIAVNNSGYCFVTGYFQSPIFIFGGDSLTNSSAGSYPDVFIAKLNNVATDTNCLAHFTIYPDTIPHNWIAVNQSIGGSQMSYVWNWGDSTFSSGATPSHMYNQPGYYNICLTILDSNGCQNNYCDSSIYIYRNTTSVAMININVINSMTYVKELIKDMQISISPNPTISKFTVNSQVTINVLQVNDVLGRLVYESKPISKTAEVSLKNEGIYFVTVTSGSERVTRKVVIE